MALRDEFEGLRGSILHRHPLPSVDSVVSELLAEEIRLKPSIAKEVSPVSNPSVFAMPPRPSQFRPYGTVARDECSFCKQKGHWKSGCPKLGKGKQQYAQQQPHQQSPQWSYRPPAPHNGPPLLPRPHNALTTASPLDPSMIEQFQQFLASQPHAMSASPQIGLSSSPSGMSPSSWILDSGASNHMSPHLSSFTSLTPKISVPVMSASGTPMPLKGVGSVITPSVSLSNVYHIPSLTLNLASVGQICDNGYLVSFSSSACYVQDPKSREVIGTGHRERGLYVLDQLKTPEIAAAVPGVDVSSFRLSPSSSVFYLWHSRLGHVSRSRLHFLASTGVLGNLKTHDISDCSGCKLAKFSALPFPKSNTISAAPFDLIHSDVWGPSPVSTKGGSRYYVSFIDDCTRYCWIYLMKRRSDFLGIYNEFRSIVKTQHAAVIKCFRCDLGGEYTSHAFKEILALDGTIYQTSCTDTPQQNGVAERKHRHILETARSLLLSASVPSEFWGEATLTSVYLINRIPTSHNSGLSPYERLYGSLPDYSSLRVFGSTCFVLLPHVERSKLTSRSAICVFLGYGAGQKGYHCFDPVSHKLYVSRHVVFLEHIPYFLIPDRSHNVSMPDLVCIDPFTPDDDELPPPAANPDTHIGPSPIVSVNSSSF